MDENRHRINWDKRPEIISSSFINYLLFYFGLGGWM